MVVERKRLNWKCHFGLDILGFPCWWHFGLCFRQILLLQVNSGDILKNYSSGMGLCWDLDRLLPSWKAQRLRQVNRSNNVDNACLTPSCTLHLLSLQLRAAWGITGLLRNPDVRTHDSLSSTHNVNCCPWPVVWKYVIIVIFSRRLRSFNNDGCAHLCNCLCCTWL